MKKPEKKRNNTLVDLLDGSKPADYSGREGLVYCRVSSKRQETDGSGLQSQEVRCLSDLQSIGVPHTKTFPDTYTGGGDFMNRPAMRGMLAFIDANPHKKYLVVFDDLKRFARDVEFHLKLKAALKARNVMLRCLNYNFDESPTGRFAEIVMAAHGEMERLENKRQVIQKQKARLEAGYWPFTAKKGYSMIKNPLHGKISKPNEEGRVIKKAMEGFAAATFVRKIDVARFLVKQGIWKRDPEKYLDQVDAMLRDVFYAGMIEYPAWGVERRPGKHEGLTTLDVHETIQRRLSKDGIHKRARADNSARFPQRGLIVCAECDGHMTAAPSKGNGGEYGYYWCHNRDCSLYKKTARQTDVESGFNRLLKKTRLKPEVEKIITVVFDRVWNEEVGDLKKQETDMERQRDTLKIKLKQLADAAVKAKSEQLREAYEDQMEETKAELKGIEGDQASSRIDLSVPYRTALGKATGLLKNPSKAWSALDPIEQHKLFYFIFERKLAYNLKIGYRTDEIPSAARLFEEFVVANSDSVEAGGFEPPCKIG